MLGQLPGSLDNTSESIGGKSLRAVGRKSDQDIVVELDELKGIAHHHTSDQNSDIYITELNTDRKLNKQATGVSSRQHHHFHHNGYEKSATPLGRLNSLNQIVEENGSGADNEQVRIDLQKTTEKGEE